MNKIKIQTHKLYRIVFFSFIMISVFSFFSILRLSLKKFITTISVQEYVSVNNPEDIKEDNEITEKPNEYIKWMEFNVPLEVLNQAYEYDINSYNEEVHFDWIKLIAYGAAKNWGTFKKNKKCAEIDSVVKKVKEGADFDELTEGLNLYDYYCNIYSSVLDGYVGEYEIETSDGIFTKKYGLKVFSPIAKNYGFSHYDDFGVSRSYGYKRRHLGNDIMGSVGTPIITIEGGYVEALGWNQYGGWRVGIRSEDGKRYYYYAHLRKNHPFVKSLKEGDKVEAGDVIGYLGMTGYSKKENVNNINTPHLHLGIQIIFDETQKEGSNQIWIDIYNLVTFLNKNKMSVYRDGEDFVSATKINFDIID